VSTLLPLLVINLERSVERRRFMQQQLDALGLSAQFLRASDGRHEDLGAVSRYDSARALSIMGHPLNAAEIGCFASHYRAWQHCVDTARAWVILEDDVRLRPGFVDSLALAAELIGQYPMLRLSAMFDRRVRVVAELDRGYRLIRYLKGPYGMQAYALSPTGAQRLLDHAEVWIKAVDAYVDSFWEHGLPSLAIAPFQAISDAQVSIGSTIGDERHRVPRPWHRALRRNATHLGCRIRRGWFNLCWKDTPPRPPEG
jgi:glycosyl transferase family 25